MTLKLNQVVALEKGAKASASSSLTQTYHTIQKAPLFAGQERTYQPKDEDGETYPPEPIKLQSRVHSVLRNLIPSLVRFYDLTLTKDTGNRTAAADVEVDGQTILTQVPVTTLLFLEKQLTDLETLVSKLPVLDSAENWTTDANGVWRTAPVPTSKTKKVKRTLTVAPATDKHAAQVVVFDEDTVVGHWQTTKLSGALPATERHLLVERVQKLKAAVKVAREEANAEQVPDQEIGQAVFSYLGW